jgi:hypothetical protein
MKKAIGLVLFTLICLHEVAAQCAMCRTQLETNVSNGNPGIAAGLNTGILYLLSIPDLAAIVLGYLWYKTSRDARKKLSDGLDPR